jgi:hypothetical protein
MRQGWIPTQGQTRHQTQTAPKPGRVIPAGHGNLVADTHTDSWHTASTIDDRPVPRSRSARRVPAPTRDEPPPRKTPRAGAAESAGKAGVPHFTCCRCIRYRAARGGRRSRRRGGRWRRWLASVLPLRGSYAVRWVPCRPVHAAAVADRRAAARFDAHADRTNRCGDFWLGGCTRRSHRVARLVVGGVLRRAGRGDSQSETGRTWFGRGSKQPLGCWVTLVTTEAPPLAGLEARRRLLARVRSPCAWECPCSQVARDD